MNIDDEKNIDTLIKELVETMNDMDPVSEEYHAACRDLEILRKTHPEPEVRAKVNPNTVISAGASLTGILAVLHYERVAIVASKAFSLVSKIRL